MFKDQDFQLASDDTAICVKLACILTQITR